MARPWRIEYEGALYHVFSRGNNQQNIFITDDDRYLFLETLGQMSERFDNDIFAYVLMSNHYHLLLRTPKANLSRSMQWLGTTYTRRFNLDHFQSGHLFQGRYKSILVENDAYLMQLSYYIHNNPLRAGIVKRLADYSDERENKRYNNKLPDPVFGFLDLRHVIYAADTYWGMISEIQTVIGIEMKDFHRHYNLKPWFSDDFEKEVRNRTETYIEVCEKSG